MPDENLFDHTIYDGHTNIGRIIEDLKLTSRKPNANGDETPTGLPQSQQRIADATPTELPKSKTRQKAERQMDIFSLGDDDLLEQTRNHDVTVIEHAVQEQLTDLTTVPLAFFIVSQPVEQRGKIHRMLPNQIMGREQTHVILTDDPTISRQHARLQLEDEPDGSQVFVIYDLGTPGGTFVNDRRIRGAVELQENDRIQIGKYHLVFKSLFD